MKLFHALSSDHTTLLCLSHQVKCQIVEYEAWKFNIIFSNIKKKTSVTLKKKPKFRKANWAIKREKLIWRNTRQHSGIFKVNVIGISFKKKWIYSGYQNLAEPNLTQNKLCRVYMKSSSKSTKGKLWSFLQL